MVSSRGLGDELDHGHQSVAQHMAEHDLAVAQALDLGQLDIIPGQLVHHIPPHPQRITCGGRQGQADDRQHAGRPHIAGGVQGREPEHRRAYDQHQRVHDQRRHCIDHHGISGTQPVRQLALEGSLHNADDDAADPRDAERDRAQAQRDTHPVADDPGNSHTVLNSPRGTKVQVEQLPIKTDQLFADGGRANRRLPELLLSAPG